MRNRFLQQFRADLRLLLDGLRGLAAPTLRGVVGRIHRVHVRSNPAAKELRHGLGHRVLATILRRPRIAVLAVSATYGAVIAATLLLEAPSRTPEPPVADYFRDIQTINLGLFGAQATLLGLVYPLVIGLVGLLFEARSSRGNRLQVYFQETAALTVGGISLALLATIGLQLLAYAVVPISTLAAVTILNTGWFVANLAALGFFMVRSLEFVRPARRHALMRSFLANTAWHDQFHRVLMLNQWGNASAYGHLPAKEGQHVVMPFDFEPPLLSSPVRGRRVFSDARFGVLAAVLRARGPESTISFAPWPGITYERKVVLVRSTGKALSPLERQLVEFAISLRPMPRREAPPSTEQILSEAASDLLSLMNAARFEEFDAGLDDAIDLHRLLYELSAGTAEGQEEGFSYGALEMTEGRSIAWTWARAYRDLVMRAGEHLTSDERFFGGCAYIAPRVMTRAIEVAPFAAVEPLLNLPAILFRALVDGAARRHAEAATSPIARGAVFTATGAGASFYRAAWLQFVAAWERLGDTLAPARDVDWEGLRRATPGLARHLRDTALRVAQAAKAGERHAIGWSVDMMLKWRHAMSLRQGSSFDHLLVAPTITLALLEQPWDVVLTRPIRRFEDAPAPLAVFDAAIDNAWIDTQVVLLCCLIGLLGAADENGHIADGPALSAGRLFRNEGFDPSAGGHPHHAQLTPVAILTSVLRLIGAGERYDAGYGEDFGGLAQQIDSLEGPNYISARVYSWSGEANIHDQAFLQLTLFLASLNTPSPGRRRVGQIGATQDLSALWIHADDAARRRLLAHLNAIREAGASIDATRASAIVSVLRGERCDAAELSARLDIAIEIVSECETEIAVLREQTIRTATIDPERLQVVAAAAASEAFSREHASFPLPLFREIARVDHVLTPFAYRMSVERGRFTSPLMQEPFGNEAEFWTRQMQGLVGGIVLRDVTQSRSPVLRAPRTATGYWTALKAAIAAIEAVGHTPIIVRRSRHEPQWLSEWLFRSDTRPADMQLVRIQHSEDPDDAYDVDLNGTPVFSSSGAGDATWVFGRELLARVAFQMFDGEQPVSVTFENDTTDVWRGAVIASFGRRISLAEGPIWKITHPKPSVVGGRRQSSQPGG